MQINRESNPAKYQITSYTANSITINNDQTFTDPIILMPEYLATWQVSDINSLTKEALLQLKDLQPELILLGTGETTLFPSAEILSVLYSAKIGLEIMNTPAACRSYAALSAEGRNVLAALIIQP